MTRRIISAVLIALGVVAIALAIASATVWRADEQATAALPERPDAPVIVSDPGVLDTVDPRVTIRATAEGQDLLLALGRTSDVLAWVGDAPHARITGLSSWEELAVSEPTAEGPGEEAAAVPSPVGSDLWVAQETGAGQAELEWEHTEGQWSLLAVTDGSAPAPEISLTWPVESRTPWLLPGLVVGGLLLLAGLALLVLDRRSAREAARRRAGAAERSEARARNDAAQTDVLPTVPADERTTTRRSMQDRRPRDGSRRPRAAAGSTEQPTRQAPAGDPDRGPEAGSTPDAHASPSEAPTREGTAETNGLVQHDAPAQDAYASHRDAVETDHGSASSSSLERAAEDFEDDADTGDHDGAVLVDPPHSSVPEDSATGREPPTGEDDAGFLQRLRKGRRTARGAGEGGRQVPLTAGPDGADGGRAADGRGDDDPPTADEEER
ncbi:hypothetical protein PU560_17575 [Georgenia sp. 10Sc9-8]|uniref:Uncharacterized protein n=1 Tax=Georgenia halotolerans TaxID=3028317 RepID=A0ABT5U252_9MICO|nr:hypothetical protein [Georgenia halotolerans]